MTYFKGRSYIHYTQLDTYIDWITIASSKEKEANLLHPSFLHELHIFGRRYFSTWEVKKITQISGRIESPPRGTRMVQHAPMVTPVFLVRAHMDG